MKTKLYLIRGSRIEDQITEIYKKDTEDRMLRETHDLPEEFVEGRDDINELIMEFYRLDESIIGDGMGKIKNLASKAMQKLKDSRPVANFRGRAAGILSKYKEKFGPTHPATKAAEEIAQHAEQNPERSSFVTTMLNGLTSLFGRPDAEEAVQRALGNTSDAIKNDVQNDDQNDQERQDAKTQGDPETTAGDVSSGSTKYPTLRTNIEQIATKKRQHVTGPVQIKKSVLVASEPSGVLEVKSTVHSGEKAYATVIQFSGVKYQGEDNPNNSTFTGSDGSEHHMVPLVLKEKNVKVTCNCLDFYHRFAPHNNKDGSLHGNYVPYVPTSDRASDNPNGRPGVCKHIIKTVESLKLSGIVK